MKRDKKDYFFDVADDSEVLRILLSHLGNSEQDTQNHQRFYNQDKSKILDAHFNNKGEIDLIEDNFGEQDYETLRAKIKEALIDNKQERIAQVICFSSEKVSGAYKYKDLFQIIPVPDFATPAPYAMADHPFILQFKYLSTPDFVTNNVRKAKYSNLYIKYINALIRTHVFNAPRYTRQLWSWEITGEKETTSKWVQEGYMIDGLEGEVEKFSYDINTIDMITGDEYYSKPFGRSLDHMVLPDNLDNMLDRVFALEESKKERFEIACTWFSQAQDIWPYSHSAAYIAVVSAIESLMEKTEETCECCGQPKFSVNKNFRKFLETYIPNIDDFPKQKKIIYKVRSDLAHGAELLLSDKEPWNFVSNTTRTNQDSLQRQTHQIVATALVNWLNNN